jgi:hypothetical protein
MSNHPLLLLSYPVNHEAEATLSGAPFEEAFPSVSPDELGFALTFFVAAANGQLRSRSFNPVLLRECKQTFLKLSANQEIPSGCYATPSAGETSLQAAFLALWEHYQQCGSQISLCARVLGFYFLMERSRGEALQDWIQLCPEHPEAVSLHPLVIEALAIVPLDKTGALNRTLYLKTIDVLESSRRPGDLVA